MSNPTGVCRSAHAHVLSTSLVKCKDARKEYTELKKTWPLRADVLYTFAANKVTMAMRQVRAPARPACTRLTTPCTQIAGPKANLESLYRSYTLSHSQASADKYTGAAQDVWTFATWAIHYKMGLAGCVSGGDKIERLPDFGRAMGFGDSLHPLDYTSDPVALHKLDQFLLQASSLDYDDDRIMGGFTSRFYFDDSFQRELYAAYVTTMPRLPYEEYMPVKQWRDAVLAAIQTNRKSGPLRVWQRLVIYDHWEHIGCWIKAAHALSPALEMLPEDVAWLLICMYDNKEFDNIPGAKGLPASATIWKCWRFDEVLFGDKVGSDAHTSDPS